jgi:hypothetical protein
MHDHLIDVELPWCVCLSLGVYVEWTLLVLSVDGGTSALGPARLLGVLPVPVVNGFRCRDGTIRA